MSPIKRFIGDRRGNVAMMFALAMVPVVGAVGAAVDYARVPEIQSKLEDALDAGVLAVGSQPEMTDAKAFEMVNKWVAVHMGDKYSGYWHLDSVTQSDDGKITAIASGDVDTTIVRVLGITSVAIGATSEVVRSIGKVELVLVLDNTGSMRGEKIAKLKTAATELVDTLAKATKDPNDLRIGLVPFSQTVNVGPTYKSATWLDKDGNSASAKSLFMGLKVNRLDLFTKLGKSWGGCVETRAMPYETTDTLPDAGSPDTLYVPYFAPDEPGARGAYGGSSYNNSYLADSSDKNILKEYGLGKKPSDWFKYVQGDILKYAAGNPYGGRTTYSMGYQYGPNSGCEIAPLLRLSTDTSKVKDAIDDMIANGNTDIPIGLTWGWNVIAPDGPFGDGVAYNGDEWTKVVVLMTDGNNANATGNQSDQSLYAGVGYSWQGRMGTTANSQYQRMKARDARLEAICAAMGAEAKGIVIYTVRVEVTSGTSTVLENCASKDGKFYDVKDVSALATAFQDIGNSIQKLRLAR